MLEPISETAQYYKRVTKNELENFRNTMPEVSEYAEELYETHVRDCLGQSPKPRGIIVIPMAAFDGNGETGLKLLTNWLTFFPQDIWCILLPNWPAVYQPDTAVDKIQSNCAPFSHLWCIPLSFSSMEHTIGALRQTGHEVASLIADAFNEPDLPQAVWDQDIMLSAEFDEVIQSIYRMFDLADSWVNLNYMQFNHSKSPAFKNAGMRLGNELLRFFPQHSLVNVLHNEYASPLAQELVFGPSFRHAVYFGYTFPTTVFKAVRGFGNLARDEHFSFLRRVYLAYLHTVYLNYFYTGNRCSPFQWTDVVRTAQSPRAYWTLVLYGKTPFSQWDMFPFRNGPDPARSEIPDMSPYVDLTRDTAEHLFNESCEEFALPFEQHRHMVYRTLSEGFNLFEREFNVHVVRSDDPNLFYSQVTFQSNAFPQVI
jgi:hypothetical protein